MALVGYARVSSVGQSLAVQLEKLQGCDPIFQEKRSGTSDNRPQLAACLQYVRRRDTLVVTKLDRLARSTLHLCQLADTLQRKGVALRVLDQAIDTSDATGRLLFNMLGAIAQFETEIRAERQLDGIANARARGVAFGRRPALTPEQVTELHARRRQGVLIKDLMAEYGLGKTALYRYLGGIEPAVGGNDGHGDTEALPQSPDTHPMTDLQDRQILEYEEARYDRS
jgi:DNA invertase Pin-like site-specific DNA recombinase